MFLGSRHFLLAQGYCLLIVNFSGSIGYGRNMMNSLLGEIGVLDVKDCGDLTKMALHQFADVVDPSKVGLTGGSHGGFLTGWLLGHPAYRDLWAVAAVRNAVFDMNYMLSATDIPDWIAACVFNKELDLSQTSPEDVKTIHERSPISVVQNVKAPLLILVGEVDLRVPPHQSYKYMHALQARDVPCKLLKYPGESHPLQAKFETTADCEINVAMWFDKYLR